MVHDCATDDVKINVICYCCCWYHDTQMKWIIQNEAFLWHFFKFFRFVFQFIAQWSLIFGCSLWNISWLRQRQMPFSILHVSISDDIVFSCPLISDYYQRAHEFVLMLMGYERRSLCSFDYFRSIRFPLHIINWNGDTLDY